MRHGVRNQRDPQLLGDLLHNGGLADTRRPHQENGSLPLDRDQVIPKFVPRKVGGHCIFDLFFGFLNIH